MAAGAALNRAAPFLFFQPMNMVEPVKRKRGRAALPEQELSCDDIAELKRVPLKTVYRWTTELCLLPGEAIAPILPPVHYGRRVRVKVSHVEQLALRLQHRVSGQRPVL